MRRAKSLSDSAILSESAQECRRTGLRNRALDLVVMKGAISVQQLRWLEFASKPHITHLYGRKAVHTELSTFRVTLKLQIAIVCTIKDHFKFYLVGFRLSALSLPFLTIVQPISQRCRKKSGRETNHIATNNKTRKTSALQCSAIKHLVLKAKSAKT